MRDNSTDDPKATLPNTAVRVISNLYDSVTPGGSYEPMFLAMDDFIEDTLTQSETDPYGAPVISGFQAHFDKAAHVFDILSRQETQTPLRYVETRGVPTAVVNRSGKVIASNARFDNAMGKAGAALGQLGELFETPADATRFENVARANSGDARAIVNISRLGQQKPVSLLVTQNPDLAGSSEAGTLLSVMMIQPQWSDDTADLLRDAFRLTEAEIATLKSFIACGSVKGIAEERKRSIRTVRTQLSRVFAQMGVESQTELALFLASLGNVSALDNDADDRVTPLAGKSDIKRKVLAIDGEKIEVLEYGDAEGQPVLLLQSTHPPALTQALRDDLKKNGFRVIAPIKPGSGKSSLIKDKPGPDQLSKFYGGILDHFGIARAVFAGQASGGLYALACAKAYPDRCEGVCLIDTGCPYRGKADLMRLPKSIRRTMVPARYFPDILYLPHRLVAANFRRSKLGEASVVDYFFVDSPVDQERTWVSKDA